MFTIFFYRFALFTAIYRGLLFAGLRLSGKMLLPKSVQLLTVLLLAAGIFLRLKTGKAKPTKGGVLAFFMVDLWTTAINLLILTFDFSAVPTMPELFACGSLLDVAFSLAAIIILLRFAPARRRRTPSLRAASGAARRTGQTPPLPQKQEEMQPLPDAGEPQ